MDRKSVIILVICGVLFLLWAQLVPRLYPPVPLHRTNQVATMLSSNLPPSELSAATNPPVASPAAPQITPSAPEEFLVEENAKGRYTFTSYGGALKLVEL